LSVLRRCVFVTAIVAVAFPPVAEAGGKARITQGSRDRGGIVARAQTGYRPTEAQLHSENRLPSPIRDEPRGPVLVPLAGQASCGHDPSIPGGLTCLLPPPARPSISRPPRKRPPSPDEIARRLADRAISLAPRPRLRFAPARRGLTGLPSFFWLGERPRPIRATAGAGGVIVTAEARPVQFVWTFGDGTDHATRGSGRRWTRRRPGTIRHTYEGKGRYAAQVEVIWEARWRLAFGAWRSLGYFSNSATRNYRVRSVIPVLVKPR
jgi:hypothetical protein